MHKFLVLLLLTYPVVCKTSDVIVPPETIENMGLPAIEREIAMDMAKYTELKGTSFITWKDDTKMIVAYRKSNTYQLFMLDKPLGELQQITDFDEPVSNAIVNPDPLMNDLLFRKDSGGDEQHQIFSLNVTNGVSRLLTDGKSKHQAVTFSHDGKQIAFSDNSRTGKYFDVYTMDPNNPESRKLIYKANHSAYFTPAWSRDAGKLLLREYISASEVASHLLDLRTGKTTNLTPGSTESIFFSLTDFTASDEFAIGLSNQGTEFRKLVRMRLSTGEVSIISNNINWDVSGFTLDREGNKGIFVVNENGYSRLYQFNTVNFDSQPLPFGEGIISSAEYSPDGSKLALTFNNARNNHNVYVINLADNERIAWTRSITAGLDLEKFVKPQLIHFPTFDEVGGKPRQIPAFYYKSASEKDKHPVVLTIHGGPEGQYRPGFLAPAQNYWLNELGIAIIAPNVRGSNGYGKAFLLLDNGLKREDSVRDIGALIDWVKQQPELDSERIAVYGGSYGGYMVLSSMTHYADDLAAGVDVVGISNFVTFLKNTSDYRRDLRRVEYGDERLIGDFLNRISPTTNAHKIKKPLFVIQGARDPRVPASEAAQIVDTLKSSDIPVWYQIGTNEGHGFRKKDNRDFMDYSIVKFWRTFLLEPI